VLLRIFSSNFKVSQQTGRRFLYNSSAGEVGGMEVFLYQAEQNFERRLKFKLKCKKNI
jgi:hypothetical protein